MRSLPKFHPMTVLTDWGDGAKFRISDALCGVSIMGASGSGKTSGPGANLAFSYLAAGCGGIVLAAKKEEKSLWQNWAAKAGRSADLVIIDATGKWRFNFLDYETKRAGEGAGLAINLVGCLNELAGAIAGQGAQSAGGETFWRDALSMLNTHLVSLPIFAGLPVSMELLRDIVNSAPQNPAQTMDESWNAESTCAAILREAEAKVAEAPEEVQADFQVTKTYWLKEFCNLSEKTRSIIVLTFGMLVRPFVSRPLAKIFTSDTNITPEAAFQGKVILVDLAVQEFREVGKAANLVWKYCFQVAVLRRTPPPQKNVFLRPCFLWADEAQYFVSAFDAEYQAVARSAGGATVYLTQNRESFRRVLGNYDAVDSLLANLSTKLFCQNCGETNEWAAKLLGERWLDIHSTNIGTREGNSNQLNQPNQITAGVSRSPQRRHFVEPATFTTLRRGGERNGFLVDAVVYAGGNPFTTVIDGKRETLPFTILTFDQR